jgi:hypothetical protein
MVAPKCFGITLSFSGSVPSAFWQMLNWGAVDRILWMGLLCIAEDTEKKFEKCGRCPVFASCTLAFALQLRKNHGKPSVRVVEKCPDIPVAAVQYTFTHKQYSSTVQIYTQTVQQYSTYLHTNSTAVQYTFTHKQYSSTVHIYTQTVQQYNTHLHTDSTQNNTLIRNTQNITYRSVRIHKHNSKNT